MLFVRISIDITINLRTKKSKYQDAFLIMLKWKISSFQSLFTDIVDLITG